MMRRIWPQTWGTNMKTIVSCTKHYVIRAEPSVLVNLCFYVESNQKHGLGERIPPNQEVMLIVQPGSKSYGWDSDRRPWINHV